MCMLTLLWMNKTTSKQFVDMELKVNFSAKIVKPMHRNGHQKVDENRYYGKNVHEWLL